MPFETFDLGQVIATAEGIKQMRRQSKLDDLREIALRSDIQVGQQAHDIAGARESREATQFRREAFFQLSRIAGQILQLPPEQHKAAAKQAMQVYGDLFAATGAQLPSNIDAIPDQRVTEGLTRMAAFAPQADAGPLETIVGSDGKPMLATRRQAVGQRPYEKSEPTLTPYQAEQLRLSTEQLSLQQGKEVRAAEKDEREIAAAEEKKANRLRNLTAGVDSVLTEVDKALKIVEGDGGTILPATGFGSGKASEVRGSTAYRLARAIDTVKANIGFDRLQAMRDASPTGGALGQVAVQELNALQNSIAALDQGLGAEELAANLRKVQAHYNNWKATMTAAVPTSTLSAPSNQAPPEAIEYLRANPQLRDAFQQKYGYLPEGF